MNTEDTRTESDKHRTDVSVARRTRWIYDCSCEPTPGTFSSDPRHADRAQADDAIARRVNGRAWRRYF